MQIIADLHTHTLSATHAFNTLDEMAAKAAALGYAALAITDHGPAMPDAPHMWHFANQTALPLVLHGVAMMYGAEANVMDTNGGWILPKAVCGRWIGLWHPSTAPASPVC